MTENVMHFLVFMKMFELAIEEKFLSGMISWKSE